MVCVIHGLFNDLSCPGCRESAFKKAASGIRPDAIEAAALRADERARRGLPEYIEICSRCGLEGRNGERKTMGCPSACQRQHDYRKYVPDVTAELDRAYTTGAALVVERDALKAQVQSLEYELKDKRGQFDDANRCADRFIAEHHAAVEHLDEFTGLGLVEGIKAMRLALIGARAHAAQYLDEKRLREEMAEQQRQYTENLAAREQQHQAELQRVAKKTWDACRFPTRLHPICGHVEMGYLDDIDLDAIVRGGK